MNAKEYLRQIRIYDKRIEQKVEEMESLRSIAEGTGIRLDPDKTSSSPNLQKMEEAVVRLCDLEAEVGDDVKRYIDLRNRIINEIHSIGDARYEEVLYLRYVSFMRMEEICCVMKKPNGEYYSYDHILHLHGEALKVFWEKHMNRMETTG